MRRIKAFVMVAPLSISLVIKQATKCLSWALGTFFLTLTASTMAQTSLWSQPGEAEWRVEALSLIDQQFMDSQRQSVESLTNRLGRSLTGTPSRDLDSIQTLLERGLVSEEDMLTLQALGVVMGDLLGRELNMDWVVYRDRAGRSRALRYLDSDIFVFPITLISRRWGVGNHKPVDELYQETLTNTQQRLPGAAWR
jgi:hypothetical protein